MSAAAVFSVLLTAGSVRADQTSSWSNAPADGNAYGWTVTGGTLTNNGAAFDGRLPPVRGWSPNASVLATYFDCNWCDVISNYCALRDFSKVTYCPVPDVSSIRFPNYGLWAGGLTGTGGWTARGRGYGGTRRAIRR